MKNTTNTTKNYSQSKLIDRKLKALNKDKPKKEKLNRDLIVQILSAYENTILDVIKETNETQKNVIAKIFNGIRPCLKNKSCIKRENQVS